MTMIVDFSDGFSSASEPVVEGAAQDDFTILNNQASFVNMTGLLLDHTAAETYFGKYELKRGAYKQEGHIMFRYQSSAWSISMGNFDGDEMIKSAIVNGQDVVLGMSGEQVQYKSGNSSAGEIKFILERILV